jgi:hypothetical protein
MRKKYQDFNKFEEENIVFKGELKEEDDFHFSPLPTRKPHQHQHQHHSPHKKEQSGMEERIEMEELKRRIKELEQENIKLKE